MGSWSVLGVWRIGASIAGGSFVLMLQSRVTWKYPTAEANWKLVNTHKTAFDLGIRSTWFLRFSRINRTFTGNEGACALLPHENLPIQPSPSNNPRSPRPFRSIPVARPTEAVPCLCGNGMWVERGGFDGVSQTDRPVAPGLAVTGRPLRGAVFLEVGEYLLYHHRDID